MITFVDLMSHIGDNQIPHNPVTSFSVPVDRGPLQSKLRLSKGVVQEPIIVIGLPRSGSTFLSHVLSGAEDLFVFDDLYCLQKAQSLRCKGTLTNSQLGGLIHFLGWSTRARIKHATHFSQFPMTWNDVDTLCDTLISLFTGVAVTWVEVMDEFLTRLALVNGKSRWGYKTPQDFHNIEFIKSLFPRVRFVFLMRDPRKVMASFKFNNSEDGKPGQYHPWFYARYWKMAIREALTTCQRVDAPLLLVRFEDLIDDFETTRQRLEQFLGTHIRPPAPVKRTNTSFNGRDHIPITATETWMCQRICGDVMNRYGYPLVPAEPRLSDFTDLATTTVRFSAYQTARFCRQPIARVKLAAFLNQLWRASRMP